MTPLPESRRLLPIVAVALVVCGVRAGHAQSTDALALSPDRQLAVARAFAPTLVFHRDEQYFPANSMDEGTIGPWPARVDQYRALSREEKLRRAALAYRVFVRDSRGQAEIVVEYWSYYLYNAYAIRGGWLPYRVSGDHPHDLERLYLVLRPTGNAAVTTGLADEGWARRAFQIVRVVANAHAGSIPPNQYTVPAGRPMAAPVSVLVELGSHAMAPDVNRDGRFTLNVDHTAVSKVAWGIRDRGYTWRWYHESFMDDRDESAVRLCGPVAAPSLDPAGCPRYALYPAEDLQRWSEAIGLRRDDVADVVGRTSWLVRAFGDTRVEHLISPSDGADGRHFERSLQRRSQSEAGFVAGFTTVDHAPALTLSRRYFREVASSHYPDLLVEGGVLLPAGRRPLVEVTVWGSYNLDAITNIVIGVGWFSESRSVSPIVGAEVRLGRLRIRPSWRLIDAGFDTRVTFIF